MLLGKRKDSGLYGLPGGWLERYEEWNECASRELCEEVGLDFNVDRFHCIETLNCKRIEDKYHAISLIMYSEINQEEKDDVKNMEPHKCEKWLWVTINQLRTNLNSLFYPLQDFLTSHPKISNVDHLKSMIKIPCFNFEKQINKDDSFLTKKTNSCLFNSINTLSTFEEDICITKDDFYLEYSI